MFFLPSALFFSSSLCSVATSFHTISRRAEKARLWASRSLRGSAPSEAGKTCSESLHVLIRSLRLSLCPCDDTRQTQGLGGFGCPASVSRPVSEQGLAATPLPLRRRGYRAGDTALPRSPSHGCLFNTQRTRQRGTSPSRLSRLRPQPLSPQDSSSSGERSAPSAKSS